MIALGGGADSIKIQDPRKRSVIRPGMLLIGSRIDDGFGMMMDSRGLVDIARMNRRNALAPFPEQIAEIGHFLIAAQ